jgi:hypothetical protein
LVLFEVYRVNEIDVKRTIYSNPNESMAVFKPYKSKVATGSENTLRKAPGVARNIGRKRIAMFNPQSNRVVGVT